MSKKCLIYCRTSGNDTKKDSLENQEITCREYAESKGYQIIDVLREDVRGVAGADFEPPEMIEAVQLAKQKKYDLLLIKDLERFSRDWIKAGDFMSQLKRVDVECEFVYRKFPKEMAAMEFMFSGWDKDNIARRLTDGRRNRVKNRQSMITSKGNTPFGYAVIEQKITEEITIFVPVIEEEEATIIRMIFKLYVEDEMSLQAIARKLDDDGIPTCGMIRGGTRFNGNKNSKWYADTIGKYLRNETYCGKWHYGKTKSKKYHVNGQRKQKLIFNEPENYISVDVPKIVSREMWQLAQERLDKRTKLSISGGRPIKHNYLLSKRLKCHCSYSMTACSTGTGKHTYLKYHCNAHGKTAVCYCDQKNIDATLADEIAWEWLESLLSDENKVTEGMRNYQHRIHKSIQDIQVRLEPIESYLEELNKKYDRHIRSMAASDDYGQKKMEPYKIELEKGMKEYESKKEELQNEMQFYLYELHLFKTAFSDKYDELSKSRWDNIADDYFYDELTEIREYVSKPLTFADKLQLFDRFNVQANLVKKDDEILLHLSCELGEGLREMYTIIHGNRQLPQTFKLVFSDKLLLDFTTIAQFHTVDA